MTYAALCIIREMAQEDKIDFARIQETKKSFLEMINKEIDIFEDYTEEIEK